MNTYHVINLHLTEACNYNCVHCFAKFKVSNELGIGEWKDVVDRIKLYFDENHIVNGRINLAGGEPLLVTYIDELIEYINSLNIKVSIITNASKLTKQILDNWTGKVEMLGISIDSLNDDTNIAIGRHFRNQTLKYDAVIDLMNYAKQKGMFIKVNTVVSKLNLKENIKHLYEDVVFDRIKILQMRINQNCNESAKNLSISNDEFKEYIKKLNMNNIIIEDESEIDSAYIFFDPKGNLISNKDNSHQKIGSIIDENLSNLILYAHINNENYNKRYLKGNINES